MDNFFRFFKRESAPLPSFIDGGSEKTDEEAHEDYGKAKSTGGDYRENIVYVNSPWAALNIAAVYRAVNLLSSSAATLTIQYKRKDRAKNYFKLSDTKDGKRINYLLGARPNDRMNSYTMMKYTVAQLLLQGNAFIYPVRNSFHEIVSFILCSPGSVTYDVYANQYKIDDITNGISVTVGPKDILHFKNMCLDGGYWGMSTIAYAKQCLSITATSDGETLKRFATGGRFKAILQDNTTVQGYGKYQDEQLKNMGMDIQDTLNRGGDILAVYGDGKLTPISMSSADMQFLESRKFNIREIARFFNIPPSKLMDDSNANYKSVEMSNVAFYVEALQPIITEIEREFAAKLLDENTYMDYKYTFDLSALYALDVGSKSRWQKTRLETGQATVNDIRRDDDRPPVDKGDDVYISTNLAVLGSPKMSGETVTSSTKINDNKEGEDDE